MSYETIKFEVADGVAKIILNRPEQANTLNSIMASELKAVANICKEDKAIRAVILTGEGKMFSAGGDLADLAGAGDGLTKKMQGMLDGLHSTIQTFSTMDAPVICAVNGHAAGAGLGMVASSNIVLSVEKARFTVAFTAAGLSPDSSTTYFLPRLIGVRRAEELMLTNRSLSASEAVEWGLINQVVPDSDLMEHAEKLAKKLAMGPTASFGSVKHLLLRSLGSSLHEQLDVEKERMLKAAETSDGKEGISAFMEKRAPNFQGA